MTAEVEERKALAEEEKDQEVRLQPALGALVGALVKLAG